MKDDNHTHIHHNSQSTSISSALLGIALGAVITYLFANKEGQKIRDQILKEGIRLLDEVQKKAQEMQEKAQETGEEIKETVQEVAEGVPQHIEQIQKKGRRFFFRRHSAES